MVAGHFAERQFADGQFDERTSRRKIIFAKGQHAENRDIF
jgi:hypothetical protein